MTDEELEIAVVRLCRKLAKNRPEIASMLGCSERTLRNYVAGVRAIPGALAAKVRALLAEPLPLAEPPSNDDGASDGRQRSGS